MSALASPAVTVRSVPQPGGVRLVFTANRVAVRPFELVVPDREVIDAARAVLDEKLTELKCGLPELGDQTADISEIYQQLQRLGRSLIYNVFGLQQPVIDKLRTFWRSAVPTRPCDGPAPVVQCIGDVAAMLPLELMPVFGFGGQDRVANRGELVEGCRNFVGFSCLVYRQLLATPVPRSAPIRRDGTGRVPLRYLHFDGLVGSARERAWFRREAKGCVDLEGPYPDSDEHSPSVPRQIFDPSVLLSGGRRVLPDQIQHFSCHCYARPDVPVHKYEIELRGGGREILVTLDEIGTEFMRFYDDELTQPAEMPLVFMNACGSSVLRATNAMSFPTLFLQNNNRGFIGSEIAIPDVVAATFSRFVYERLLRRGKPLGEAILGARVELLERYNNPLGIAYTAYADPGIQVEPLATEEKGAA